MSSQERISSMRLNEINVGIVGGGHGGVAEAGHLAALGVNVYLYNRTVSHISEIQRTKTIVFHGAQSGSGRLAYAGNKLDYVVRNSKVILIILPAYAHEVILRKIRRSIADGQIVVMMPGKLGGGMLAWNMLRSSGKRISVFEAESVVVGARRTHGNKVKILGLKKRVKIGGINRGCSKEGIRDDFRYLQKLHKEFRLVSNIFQASFAEVGVVLHPVISVLNAARIENREDFLFYISGVTPSVGRLIENIDKERLMISRKYGIRSKSVYQTTKGYYHSPGDNIVELLHRTKTYRTVHAPNILNNRYLIDDVFMSLTVYQELGNLAGISTKHISALISLAEVVTGHDCSKFSRSLKGIGLNNLKYNAVKSQVKKLKIL
jgi:opine dehydrogenase